MSRAKWAAPIAPPAPPYRHAAFLKGQPSMNLNYGVFGLTILGFVFALGFPNGVGTAPARGRELAPELVRAWKKVAPDQGGFRGIVGANWHSFQARKEPPGGALPAFKLRHWEAGDLRTCPFRPFVLGWLSRTHK